jgi:hypothetical protein
MTLVGAFCNRRGLVMTMRMGVSTGLAIVSFSVFSLSVVTAHERGEDIFGHTENPEIYRSGAGEFSTISCAHPINELLRNNTAKEKANINAAEIAKIGSIPKTTRGKFKIEV